MGNRVTHTPIQSRAGLALGSEAERHCSLAPGCLTGYEEVIQIPKGSVHIDIRELNLSINYLGEMGLRDTEIPARHPLVCYLPAVKRAWERPSKENLPLQQRMGLGVPAWGWGQRRQRGLLAEQRVPGRRGPYQCGPHSPCLAAVLPPSCAHCSTS